MVSSLYDRIRQLCSSRGITVKRLESELGFGKSTIVRWADGHSPSADKLVKVATYLGVSVDYLLGITDSRKPIDEILGDADIISFQRAHERMTPAERERMMKLLRIGFDYAFAENEKTGDDQ